MTPDQKVQFEKAQAQIEAVYNDKVATINGRDYHFTVTTHRQRVAVFAFLSKIQSEMAVGNFAFLDTKEFAEVERIIGNIIVFEGSNISKLPQHWEAFPQDYLIYVTTALSVISFPFMRGKSTA